MLSKENLLELRHNLGSSQLARRAGILRAELVGLPTHLQSHSEPAPDADAHSSLETVVEMALMRPHQHI
jgi:hypothetical protein